MTSEQIALVGYTIHTVWFATMAGVTLALWLRDRDLSRVAIVPWLLAMAAGFAIASGRLLTWLPRTQGLELFRAIFLVAGLYGIGWLVFYVWYRAHR